MHTKQISTQNPHKQWKVHKTITQQQQRLRTDSSLIYYVLVLSGHSKKNTKTDYQNKYLLSLNAGRKNSRMFHGKHSEILLTLIKQPFSIKTFDLAISSGRLRQVLVVSFGALVSDNVCLVSR